MKEKKHIVIFSHGFGTRKDDLGLLTDIADHLPNVIAVLFDYYDLYEPEKLTLIKPISEQKKILKNKVAEVKNKYPNSIIDIIAHSQGTIIPAIAGLNGIRKTILLAPVFNMGLSRTLKRYSNRKDALINLDNISITPRLDGYLRVIPKKYWKERVKIKPFSLFNKFSKKTELIIINAKQDNVLLEKENLSKLKKNIKIIDLDGDHNFNGKDRKNILEIIEGIINNLI